MLWVAKLGFLSVFKVVCGDEGHVRGQCLETQGLGEGTLVATLLNVHTCRTPALYRRSFVIPKHIPLVSVLWPILGLVPVASSTG